jgi:nicotinamidase-related amidase
MVNPLSEANEALIQSAKLFGDLPDFDLTPKQTAFVIVDMQYLDAHRDYGMGAEVNKLGLQETYEYFFSRIETVVIPHIKKLQDVCRRQGIEVIFLRIASLVKDCRDVSPHHKSMKLFAPAGAKEAEILEEIKPMENEMVITKGCSGVFNGTAFDQILENMGIKNLIFAGVATNYCVETSVRDAGDRGYNAILLSDGCAGLTAEQDRFALEILDNNYCKVKTTDEVIKQIQGRDHDADDSPHRVHELAEGCHTTADR